MMLARDSILVIYSCLEEVVLEQEAAFVLASVPVLALVVVCKAFNLVRSEFGSHGRVRNVWNGSAQPVTILQFLCSASNNTSVSVLSGVCAACL